MLLLLAACSEPGNGVNGAPPTDSASDPFDCGEAPEVPDLASETWSATGAIPASGILTFAAGPGGVPLYAGSHNSGVWSSDDRGASWTRSVVLITHTLANLVVSPVDATVVYRSSAGILNRSENGGGTWEVLPLGEVSPEHQELVFALAIAPWDATQVYAVMDSGQTYTSSDAGDHFSAAGLLPAQMVMGGDDPFNKHAWRLVPPAAAGGRFLFSDGAGFYTSDDNMASWQGRFQAPHAAYSLLRDPGDAQHLLLADGDGLRVSRDEGTSWNAAGSAEGITLGAWSEDGNWLAFAATDTLYISENGGESFTTHAFDWIQAGAMAIIGGDRLILSWDNGIVASDDRGATWVEISDGAEDIGISVVAPHPVCSNRVFIGSRCSGGMYSTDTWGSAWTHVNHYFHYVMGIHYDPSNPENVWAISDDSLLSSNDGGETWADAYVRYHFHAFAIHPDDSGKMLLGSVGSGEWKDAGMHVYKTDDDGASWYDSSGGLPNGDASAHTMLYWPDNPDIVLLGTYKGGDVSHQSGTGVGLFRSADGGENWSRADIPVANISWLVPTADGVVAATDSGAWKSTDEGNTWSKLDGPDGWLLSADFKGTRGVTLAQNGEVWKTNDGGESWVEMDSDLPANPTSWLNQIAISADGKIAWATVFERGVYRIALE